MKEFTWYAVEKDEEDNDWGTGSFDLAEAKKIAKAYGPDARIAVISGWAESLEDANENGLQDTECKEIILQENF